MIQSLRFVSSLGRWLMHGGNFWKEVPNGDDNTLTLALDCPNEKQNVLSVAVLEELSEILDKLMLLYKNSSPNTKDRFPHDQFPKVLVLTSAKRGSFCAGAKIEEFLPLLENPDAAGDLLDKGHQLILKIRNAPFPIVAAINGLCLGGGLELAMACKFRVAVGGPKTKIGLPECALGIIPGFGGTQILPRLVGLMKALEIILKGAERKMFSAEEMAKFGLVDKVVAEGDLIKEAKALALSGDRNSRNVSRSVVLQALPAVRHFILSQARKRMIKESRGIYPALFHAIESIGNFHLPLEDGLKREKDLFSKCLRTREANNLINIFLLDKEARGCQPDRKVDLPKRPAVLGAGLMGSSIAYSLICNGFQTHMHDSYASSITKALIFIESELLRAVKKGAMTPEQAERTRNLLTYSSGESLSKFAGRDFVIEAIIENLDLKQTELRRLERHLDDDAVIATNTSSLLPSEIAKGLFNPRRLTAMHFFNPAHIMPLVEMVGHPESSPEAMAKTLEMAKMMKKVPIIVDRECQGLVVNRILMRGFGWALFELIANKVNPWHLDSALERYGFKMGPFKTMDLVGWDTGEKVLREMAGQYPDNYPVRMRDFELTVRKDTLGAKTGRGFYHWQKGKAVKANKSVLELLRVVGSHSDLSAVPRVVTAMELEAYKIFDEGVCASKDMIDLAMIYGAGICPNRRGIFGIQKSVSASATAHTPS